MTSFQYLLPLVSAVNPSFRQLETVHHLQERIFGLSCVNLFPDARYSGDSEKSSLLAFVSAIADARNHESKGLFTWRWGPQVIEVTRPAVIEKKKKRLHTILQPRGAEVRFLEVVVALEIKEFEQRNPKLTS